MRGDFYFLHSTTGALIDAGMSIEAANKVWHNRSYHRIGALNPVKNSQSHHVVALVHEGTPEYVGEHMVYPQFTAAVLKVSNRNIQTVLEKWNMCDMDGFIKIPAEVFGFGNTGDNMYLLSSFFEMNDEFSRDNPTHKSIGGIRVSDYPEIKSILAKEHLHSVSTSNYNPGVDYSEIPEVDNVVYIVPYEFKGLDAHLLTDTETVFGARVVKRVSSDWYEYMPPTTTPCKISKINTAGVLTVKGRPDILFMPIFTGIDTQLARDCTTRYFIDYIDTAVENAGYAKVVYEAQARQMWLNMMSKLNNSQTEAALQGKKIQAVQGIGNVSLEFCSHVRNLREINSQLNLDEALKNKGQTSDQISKLIEWGCTVDADGQISGHVDNIILRHKDEFYKIGDLSVTVRSDAHVTRPVIVKTKPGTRRYMLDHEHPHPHADTAGVVCLGSVADFVHRELKTGGIAGALAAVYTIMRQYNASSPHRRIENAWPKCDKDGNLLNHNEEDFPIV